MQLSDAIYGRRAVRNHTGELIDYAQIGLLIRAATQAPSAMNRQPWSFCVVRDQRMLTHISQEAKAYMLRITPVGLIAHHLEEMLGNSASHLFYHAPVLIIISATQDEY